MTLNVHPAGGVRAHEEMYVEMAKALGVDYANEDPILCDPADPDFWKHIFSICIIRERKRGLTSGGSTGNRGKFAGMKDWIHSGFLIIFHFLDSAREGKRPLTFSRYAGPGSHRYPIGISGDTIVTWESLDFQPYFTLTASNIGYGWWSHDIGGHMLGYKDDEMTVRWVQLGIYSPIMRLHSSSSEFNGKDHGVIRKKQKW
mgnify:CR=1 FL=1